MSPALMSAGILAATLLLFISERVRHDLVALLALFACLGAGLLTPREALMGFSDPAVLTVAAVLVVGRAVELTGVAAAVTRVIVPAHAAFHWRLSGLLVASAVLSAFMNNIAALVIAMPMAGQIARESGRPPAATLMPIAFATILGGMTTLIGTPANLILSSVRQDELGAPLGFFQMTPVGVAVTVVGLGYLALIGWRLIPHRPSGEREAVRPWQVFELSVPDGFAPSRAAVLRSLLRVRARVLAHLRDGERVDGDLRGGDRLLVASRRSPWTVAERTGLRPPPAPPPAPGTATARCVVGHGSFLVGLSFEAVRIRSADQLRVIAAGPRAARERQPLARLKIQPGDQLYIRGSAAELSAFVTRARLLEVDRLDRVPLAATNAAATVGIFAVAIAAAVSGLDPAIAFLGAATALAATRLISSREIYRAIDWSIIVLLAAMIPVGQSFASSGAADLVARGLAELLTDASFFVVIAALCSVTLLLTTFLNNAATAVVMGPFAISLAELVGVSPDAALLSVLVGSSAAFLSPIGHQNTLLVMSPGGYRFTDFARVGALLSLAVVGVTAAVLTFTYGGV